MTLAHATVEELRKLAEAATPGPWGPVADPFDHGWRIIGDGWRVALCDTREADRNAADAALIAAMRNALPALLDRLERAERHVDPDEVIGMLRFMGHDRAAELVHTSFVAEVTPRAAPKTRKLPAKDDGHAIGNEYDDADGMRWRITKLTDRKFAVVGVGHKGFGSGPRKALSDWHLVSRADSAEEPSR